MITISIDDFIIELKDGSIKNVGAATKTSTVKLYDVTSTSAREFGDDRAKLTFTDADDNHVEVAIPHTAVPELITTLEEIDNSLE